ncbi:MAG: hypothetical protein WC998_06400, partial [Candidatus Paceibacterota bacterium]
AAFSFSQDGTYTNLRVRNVLKVPYWIIYQGDTLAVVYVSGDTIFVNSGVSQKDTIVNIWSQTGNDITHTNTGKVTINGDSLYLYPLPDEATKVGRIATLLTNGEVEWASLVSLNNDMLDTVYLIPTTRTTWLRDTTAGYIYPAHLTDNVGIGTATPTQKLDVTGNIRATGNLNFSTTNYSTMVGITTGSDTLKESTGVGESALNTSTMDYTTAIGYSAGSDAVGDYGTFFGNFAGFSNNGDKNINLGVNSGTSQTGNNNINIGWNTGQAATTNNCINIGYEVGASGNTNNQFIVGAKNLNATTLMQGDLLTNMLTVRKLTVDSSLYLPGLDSTAKTGLTLNYDNSTGKVTFAVAPSGTLTGTGTANTVPKFTAATVIGNSQITDDGTKIALTGYLTLPATTSSTTGVIYKGTDRFMHNYKPAANDGYNTFLGVNAGNFTMTSATAIQASYNLGLGDYALYDLTTGFQNVAFGYKTMQKTNSGNSNVAVGIRALWNNTSGSTNTAIGYQAIVDNLTGNNNTAVGNNAMSKNLGNYNTAVGGTAAYTNTSGNNNVSLGYAAGFSNATSSYNVFLGYRAGYNELGGNKLYIAKDSTSLWRAAAVDGILIYGNFDSNYVNIFKRVAIGAVVNPTYALQVTGTGSFTGNLRLPVATSSVGSVYKATNTWLHDYGTNNIFLGSTAGNFTMTGTSNIGIGTASEIGMTSGRWNTAVGDSTMMQAVSDANTAFGDKAMHDMKGSGNTALGRLAMKGSSTPASNTGSYNTAVGGEALEYLTTGSYNTVGGYQSGFNLTTGSHNTLLGWASGLGLVTGAENVMLGDSTGYSETGSNKLYIDNSPTATPLIHGDFGTNQLWLNGNVQVTTGTESSSSAELSVIGDTYINDVLKSGTETIADNDATPDVSGGNTFIYGGSANAVTITDFDSPVVGAYYTIIGNSDTYTVTFNDSGNFNLDDSPIVLGHDDVVTFYVVADNDYIQSSKPINN